MKLPLYSLNFLIVVLSALPIRTLAQTLTVAASQPKAFFTSWPSFEKDEYHVLELVTISEPGVRHRCRVRIVTGDAIVCKGSHHQKQVTYPRADVASIILPPSHGDRNKFSAELAFVAAGVAGSFFAPTLAVAIILRTVPALFVGLRVLFTGTEDGADHNEDYLLYQKPGVPLTVRLKPA